VRQGVAGWQGIRGTRDTEIDPSHPGIKGAGNPIGVGPAPFGDNRHNRN